MAHNIIESRVASSVEHCPVCGHETPPHRGVYADIDKNTAIVDGVKIKLPAHQAKVLDLLVGRRGRSVRKESIHDHLYAMDPNGGPYLKILDVYICHLRAKLRGTRAKIITHWGVGYSFEMPSHQKGEAA